MSDSPISLWTSRKTFRTEPTEVTRLSTMLRYKNSYSVCIIYSHTHNTTSKIFLLYIFVLYNHNHHIHAHSLNITLGLIVGNCFIIKVSSRVWQQAQFFWETSCRKFHNTVNSYSLLPHSLSVLQLQTKIRLLNSQKSTFLFGATLCSETFIFV